MSPEADTRQAQRLEQLQLLADDILDKLRLRVAQEDPLQMNVQSVKHITGVMKDLRDIQLSRAEGGRQEGVLQVLWEGALEQYSE